MPAVTAESKLKLSVSKRKSSLKSYIKELMEAKNLTQKQCAAVIGIEQGPFSVSLRQMKFKTEQLLTLLIYLEADPQRLAEIMGKK